MTATSPPWLSEDYVTFEVVGASAGKPGLLLQGNAQVNGGLGSPLGNGLFCVTGQTQRSQVQFTTLNGSAEFTDLQGLSFGAASFGAGASTLYQFWYRVPPSTYGDFNFSNALGAYWVP